MILNLNDSFLNTLTKAFKKYLQTSSRSNEKLKILHSKIAMDLTEILGNKFSVCAYEMGNGKEKEIMGRYYKKRVDISIINKNDEEIAGIAVKFIMSNYSQNSNNYFEGMLGETANLRSLNKPYFQILILPEIIPYFDKNGNITKREKLTQHHLNKYIKLSNDNANIFFHTPNKTLLAIINFPDFSGANNKDDYKRTCLQRNCIYSHKFKRLRFGNNLILNNYAEFLDKIRHTILAI